MKTKIKTTEEELKDCRAAFALYPKSKLVWCCHHEEWTEELTEPFENRINYILSNKREEERAVRFRNFRPVINEIEVMPARKAYYAATKSAYEAYLATIKPANEVFDAATKSAKEAYDAATKQAREAYYATITLAYEVYEAATKPALEDYLATIKPANEAYNAAIKLADEVYSAKLTRLHNEEWPDNTWSGRSIFGQQ